jgi:hypothetical protein
MIFATLTAYIRPFSGYSRWIPIHPETAAKLFNGQFRGLQVIVVPEDGSTIAIVRATGEALELVVTSTR